jgi:hypothetical protein
MLKCTMFFHSITVRSYVSWYDQLVYCSKFDFDASKMSQEINLLRITLGYILLYAAFENKYNFIKNVIVMCNYCIASGVHNVL